jgi:hypothetical protein
VSLAEFSAIFRVWLAIDVADTPIEHTPTVSAGEDITTSINKIVTLTATGVDPVYQCPHLKIEV